MTKQVYEEALADVRRIKEVAEANAQRAVLDAVTPRIRDLIEQEMLREVDDLDEVDEDDESIGAPGAPPPRGDLVTDLVVPVASADVGTAAAAITPPDEEGKVTLDLDALCPQPGAPVAPPLMGAPLPDHAGEYEVSLESIEAMAPLLNATRSGANKEFELRLYKLGEAIVKFSKAGRLIRESKAFRTKIAQMISRVEDMYGYVQESVTDPAKKSSYESRLESYFRVLNKLQEQTMSKRTKKMMNEEDVTLKLTGLPDDIDLDSVGVDLITGEEGDEADMAPDADGGEEGGEAGEDMDLGDLDMGGSEGDEGEDDMGESRRLSDDTIVEIDEKMLSREIARMRRLREEFAAPTADGHGTGSKEFDDFGGGSDDGEPIEHDLADKSPAKAALPLGEADEDLDEQDQLDEDDDQMDEQDDQMDEMDAGMDEMDDLDQLGVKRKEEEYGPGVADQHETPHQEMPMESAKRRLAFEQRLQERARRRASSLKKEAARAKSHRDGRKFTALKREYAQVAKRFNESVNRSKKLKSMLAESARLAQRRLQNGGTTRSAGSSTEKALRNKLAETNLINAKLLFTNKLLQNESLTTRQKAQVIEQLDSAKTVREAKLVYESLAKTLVGTSKSVNENRDRRVMGSASRTTRPASTQTLNEGYEAERWARLAGITK